MCNVTINSWLTVHDAKGTYRAQKRGKTIME